MGAITPTPSGGKNLTLSFGLVQVGVKYAPFIRERRLKGHFVDPDTLGPVHQQYVNDAGEVVKQVVAYEYEDKQVVLNGPEALKSERDGRLELCAFLDPAGIDPIYVEQTYVVWPVKGQETGYDLLCSVLRQSGKALMGTAVLTKSTKAIVLRFFNGSLIAHVCTYDACIDWDTQALVAKAYMEREEPEEALKNMAESVFGALPDSFDLASVFDEYDLRLREAVAAQAKGRKPKKAAEKVDVPTGDLMAALKATVAATKPTARKKVKA
jgi:Ku protein